MLRLLTLLLLALLAACGPYSVQPPPSPQSETMRIDALRARDLALYPGKCVWLFRLRKENDTDESIKPPIFAQFPRSDKALMTLNGREVSLRRASNDGQTVGGLPQNQVFNAYELTAQLMIRRVDGSLLEGVLSLTKASGWSTVIPLSGGKLCQ